MSATDRGTAIQILARIIATSDNRRNFADLEDVVDKAQNGPPLGPGDGSLSEKEWTALRDLVKAARAFEDAVTKASNVMVGE